MKSTRNAGAEPGAVARSRGTVHAMMMITLCGLTAGIPALADPPKPAVPFAHRYAPLYIDSMASADPALTLREPSFQTLIENQPGGLLGSIRQEGLIGGIHQGAKAVTTGAAAGQPVRFEYRPEGQIVLRVGDQSMVTGLLAEQARPMASLVEQGNNGLVTLTDPAIHHGKRGYRPQVAGSYLDTQEGYWLLWADAISEDLFYRTAFEKGDYPDGLTIVDSQHPVTIRSADGLDLRGGEPRVAFWKYKGSERARIVRYDDFGLVMKPRDQNDAHAVETVRRVFKWAPVMRLAAQSDPAAFRSFVRRLEEVRIAHVTTPRLLIEE